MFARSSSNNSLSLKDPDADMHVSRIENVGTSGFMARSIWWSWWKLWSCDELRLLNSHLTPTVSVSESRVFYLKMKGDYIIVIWLSLNLAPEMGLLAPDMVLYLDISPEGKVRENIRLFTMPHGRSRLNPDTIQQVNSFIIHLSFMVATALFVMHVQVATRFLFASPPVYWFASYLMS
uniref:GPI mannosyltransferase 2 n=1 Tax=Chenopodium quinoa TaxID=63459 RepID=A0A803MYK5_CHEQI